MPLRGEAVTRHTLRTSRGESSILRAAERAVKRIRASAHTVRKHTLADPVVRAARATGAAAATGCGDRTVPRAAVLGEQPHQRWPDRQSALGQKNFEGLGQRGISRASPRNLPTAPARSREEGDGSAGALCSAPGQRCSRPPILRDGAAGPPARGPASTAGPPHLHILHQHPFPCGSAAEKSTGLFCLTRWAPTQPAASGRGSLCGFGLSLPSLLQIRFLLTTLTTRDEIIYLL